MNSSKVLTLAAHNYAVNWESNNSGLDWEDLTPIEVSELDFAAGARWAAKVLYNREEIVLPLKADKIFIED